MKEFHTPGKKDESLSLQTQKERTLFFVFEASGECWNGLNLLLFLTCFLQWDTPYWRMYKFQALWFSSKARFHVKTMWAFKSPQQTAFMYNNTTVSSVIMWNVPVLLIFLFVRYCGKHHPPHDETLAANRELEMVEKASQKAVARKPKNYSSFFFIILLPWLESAVSRPQGAFPERKS